MGTERDQLKKTHNYEYTTRTNRWYFVSYLVLLFERKHSAARHSTSAQVKARHRTARHRTALR